MTLLQIKNLMLNNLIFKNIIASYFIFNYENVFIYIEKLQCSFLQNKHSIPENTGNCLFFLNCGKKFLKNITMENNNGISDIFGIISYNEILSNHSQVIIIE